METYIYNALREYLDGAYDDDILSIVRELNSYNGSCEDLDWMSMDDFDDVCSSMSPLDIASRIFNGDFNPSHDYFRFDGYENFESCDFISFDDYDKDEIINAIDDTPYMYLPCEIQDVIDEAEEAEEEDEEDEEEDEDEEE